MDKQNLKDTALAALLEYTAATEAWEDAMLAVDTESGEVSLVEEEETEGLPDRVDLYEIMDFVEMDPQGEWHPDEEALDRLVADYE